MNMEAIANFFAQVDVWLGYALTLISLISFIVAVVKNIKDKNFNKVKDLVKGFVQEANNLKAKDGVSNVSGQTKKEIVMAKIRVSCTNFGIKFNEDVWSSIVEMYVDLMNTEKK